MWNLESKAARNKFAAIPETGSAFHGHQIDAAGNEADGPSNEVVDPVVAHISSLDKNNRRGLVFVPRPDKLTIHVAAFDPIAIDIDEARGR